MPFANINFSELIKAAISLSPALCLSLSLFPSLRSLEFDERDDDDDDDDVVDDVRHRRLAGETTGLSPAGG